MANYRIALVVKKSSVAEEFLVVRQNCPSPIPLDDGRCYVDSDLWDLPSFTLSQQATSTQVDSIVQTIAEDVQNALARLELRGLDASPAVQQILMQICIEKHMVQPWRYWHFVEEADFGPGVPLHTVFFITELKSSEYDLPEGSKWLSFFGVWRLHMELNPREDRVGPLAVAASSSHFGESMKLKFNINLRCQEYPPGVLVVPMDSLTLKPFKKTNLIVFAPEVHSDFGFDVSKFAAYGDALVMDPGCHFRAHGQLAKIVTSLPRKLVIFVTHHHRDHVDGLSKIRRCNPDAILLAHEATLQRIGKGASGIKCFPVHGASRLCIGGEEFQVISAPGHTDGHMALLHVRTRTLIVGDHCVGQGSSVLDAKSGGNMKDYLETTYHFLQLYPSTIIPMHGRPNLWPTELLCGYIKHRKGRETKVLKAIESGAQTLHDIVSKAYADVYPSMWMAAASNVKLHVEHLAYQNKLPMDFNLEAFLGSCRGHFLLRWFWSIVQNKPQINSHLRLARKLFPILFIGIASYLLVKSKFLGKE